HYVLRVSFDHTKRTVFGDTTVRLKPLADNFREAELDAAALKFTSVTLDGSDTPLKYRTASNKVIVTLDRAYTPADEIALRFKYTAQPKKGVYFVNEKAEGGRRIHSRQIWTQGEPDEAHHWFPNFDFPSDKATTEQIITVQKGMTVIGNGHLLSVKQNDDGTVTSHFKMDIPHPTYLVSFVVGEYVRLEDKYRDIPLGYYMYPGTESVAARAYGKTKQMLEVFEQLTRVDYPFNKYDQTIVANFQFGGMENITATTMSDNDIFYANVDFLRGNVEDLVAHEIAHSWFGNNVTMKNWAELWLNEGFATFLEAAVREKLNSRADYLRKIENDAQNYFADAATNRRQFGLFNETAGNVNTLFDRPAITYNKGGAVVHQLREQMGDEAFWKGLNFYLTRHRFGSVETTDLIKALEDSSGQKLQWFFDQWVYGTGHPALTVKHRYNAAEKSLEITVSQTQRSDRLTPEAFRLPIEIAIRANGETRIEKIDITKRSETFRIATASEPEAITLDPSQKIVLKTLKMTS
ncbi:MAG: DUF3458 domain-containing protein, partial [Blastocatellia bacterium]|nr:DUF3458 domain-containing protein [Blastocatellia bacterium]